MKLKRSKTSAKAPTATAKQFLFAYAQLQKPGHPSDCVARGDLRARDDETNGTDGAAKFGGNYHGIVYGQRLPVSDRSLKLYDGAEKPDYKRVRINTSQGPAWTYEYVGADFDGLAPIPNGHFEEFRRDLGRQAELTEQMKSMGAQPPTTPEDVPQGNEVEDADV